MAIVTEKYSDTLERHYSDINHYIIQNETGAKYAEAIDVVPCRYTYTESEEEIPQPEPPEPLEDSAVDSEIISEKEA